jgi:antitoxin component YwqK of YwqJK toxin-antitoxin module
MPAYEHLLLHPNGKPLSGVERLDAERTVLRTWAEDGTLILEAGLNGEREYDGPYRSWWDSGALKEEGTFRNGKRVGTYRCYHQSGELWSQHQYD